MPDEPERDRLVGELTGRKGPLHIPLEGAQDEDQAAWLAEDLGQRVRYSHATKGWHRWNPKSRSWRPDKTRETEREVIDMAKERAAVLAQMPSREAEASLKLVRKLFDISRVETALETLATLSMYNTDGQDWDTEPFLLGCSNGVVDLRTATLLTDLAPADSKVTKSTGFPYDPAAQCPTFVTFLRQITSGDDGLAAFYLQWFGYSLFGRNYEQKFLILAGQGRNGKGAMTHAVRHAIGEYDADANQGIYMKSRMGATPSSAARSDLMCLKGARFAVMSEPEGGQFNEELLKAHTGGDPIVARALYKPEMRWEPTHTITFLTNQPPAVDDVGPAMAERVLVADFRERYEGKAANTKLYEMLEKEAVGILALLVKNAAIYWQAREQGGGLWLPERVAKASKAYIDANDPVGQALVEAFVMEKGAKTNARELYRTYTDWHAMSDDPNEVLSQSAFGLLLHRRGLTKRRSAAGNVYLGIRPKSAMEVAVDDAA